MSWPTALVLLILVVATCFVAQNRSRRGAVQSIGAVSLASLLVGYLGRGLLYWTKDGETDYRECDPAPNMKGLSICTSGLPRYSSTRSGGDAWAEDDDVINAWKRGCVSDVPARTLEIATSLACCASCTECPYREARRAAGLRRVARGQFAAPDDVTVMTLDTCQLVIDRSVEAGVRGALWTGGGEPTLCQDLPAMLRYSAARGLVNGLYTNSILFGERPELPVPMLDPRNRLVFIRHSLNVVTPETGRRFSCASHEDIDAQFRGLAAVFEARAARCAEYEPDQHIPAVQVSFVGDERNVGDLPQLCKRVAGVVKEHSQGCHAPNDIFLARPLTKHCRSTYSPKDHDDSVINAILAVCGKNGFGRRVIEDAGMRVNLGFGLPLVDDGVVFSYEDLIRDEYARRSSCWSVGLFLTVGPDATVYLCCDRNCYKDWAIGNLKSQTVQEIYHSPRRQALLRRVHSQRCGPSVCEATCRTGRLNRIAEAIMSGQLTRTEIEQIRSAASGSQSLLLG